MKTQIALALVLTAAAAFAGETQFHTPTTDRAQQSQQLLSNAAHAVNEGNRQVSDLWVFPTADRDTVFAQYVVTSQGGSAEGSTGERHLEVLKLKDGRIVSRDDLTRAGF
jgi:hypothetical protein